MANRDDRTHTSKRSPYHYEIQNSQQTPHLSNHHLGYDGNNHFDPYSYQGAATYQNGQPYPDADQFFREASQSNANAPHQCVGQSTCQTSHGHGRKVTHQTEQKHLDAKEYRGVDRTPYQNVSDVYGNFSGLHHSGGSTTITSQAHIPLQRFQMEPENDQPWNGITGFQPVSTSKTGGESKQQQYRSRDSSTKAENGSSTSLGKPY